MKIKVYENKDFFWPLSTIIICILLFWNLARVLPYGYFWILPLGATMTFYIIYNFFSSKNILINKKEKILKIGGTRIKMQDITSITEKKVREYLDFPSFSRIKICFTLKDSRRIYFPRALNPSIADRIPIIISKLRKELSNNLNTCFSN